MEYNFLNLPSHISVSEDDYMDYTWYYDGTKVSVEGYEGSNGADYIGSFVYNNDDDGFIRDIRFGDGIVRETSNGVYETLYWVTDHLGSPRVAFTLDDSEYGVNVAERNDYYPFGGRWDDGSGHGGTIAATANRYALSGKERQTMSRMGSYLAAHESLLDFGARFYDPATAIFLQQDPLAEKYYNISPYAYCANNPVNFVDPDGRFIGFISDVVSVGMGVRSFAKNISAGNIRGAVWDGVGVVVDLAAAAIPVVPGGVGYVRAGINAADNAIDAAKVIKTGGALAGELNQFEKAAEFGVDSYNALRKNVLDTYGTGSGLEVHHLIEQRFADTMGLKSGDMPSIVLTKDEHKSFTAAWKEAIGYKGSGNSVNTETATKDQVLSAAKKIYKDYPELLKNIEEAFK